MMWKDSTAFGLHSSHIKNNRASSLSVKVAAFISALFLSLLCSLFYNAWSYEIQRLKAEEGDWQGRIEGSIEEEDLDFIRNFASVKEAIVNEERSDGDNVAVDIYFESIGNVLTDMQKIAAYLGLEPEAVSYHHSLLAMYLVRDPDDPAPRLVFPLFLAVTVMSCFSLVMIIYNSFEVSMKGRIHQFGIFSSIGATPAQIRAGLLEESAALCSMPAVAGIALGVGISRIAIQIINELARNVPGRIEEVWSYHPLVLLVTVLAVLLTIGVSAWIPAVKLSRLTPLEAIRHTGELCIKKRRNSCLLAFLFGIEGELASNALRAQRKALRTASLALTCSFLSFSLTQCFFALTKISQEMTYFARYQDSWDIMVTVKDREIDVFRKAEKLKEVSGVQSSTVYQKAAAKRMVLEEELSEAFLGLGGMENAAETYVASFDGGWLVNAPILILDDASFLDYCKHTGAKASLDGAVILNRIRDSRNPNFRSTEYFPYVKEELKTTVLRQAGCEGQAVELPVLAYTWTPPVLKEAYGELDYYEMVHFLPESLWQKIKGQIGGAEEDTYIRILGREGVSLEELNRMEQEILKELGGNYEIQTENRIQDKINNDRQIDGMMLVIGSFCALLAAIGVGNVFSNTLGFAYQRKREFARYLSIGLTPTGIKKIFCIEAAVLVGKPVTATLILTGIAVWVMIKAIYLEPMVFMREAPVLPVLGFVLAVLGIVALAYYLGGRKVLQGNLSETLRDDTMI